MINSILIWFILFAPFIFLLVFNSLVLWLATKVLKFSKHDLMVAVKTVLIHEVITVLVFGVSYVLFGVVGMLVYLGPLFLLMYILSFIFIGLASLGFLWYLLKRFYEVTGGDALKAVLILFVVDLLVGFILGVLLVAPALWQLGVFNVSGPSLVSTGFGKLHPLMPSVVYRGDEFSTSFVNGVGMIITVKNVSVTEVIKMEECAVISLPGEVVKAGDVFQVSGNCPYKVEGEPFDVKVEITYESVISGIKVTHIETGHIKGVVEAS